MSSSISPRSSLVGLLAAASLAGALLTPHRALAADLDPGYADIPPPVQQQVTFGSGWYVRGDIGVDRKLDISPSKPTFDTTNPASIPVPPNLDFRSSSNLGYTASGGAGYQFTPYFRADVIFDYHEPLSEHKAGAPALCPGGFRANGTQHLEGCLPHYVASLNSYDVLANGYVDLGNYYGIFTPYVGAGVGVAFGQYKTAATYTQSDGTSYDIMVTDPTTGTTYHGDFDTSSTRNFYNFAFALMAGFSVDVYAHTKLDIGYRYLNLGKIQGTGGNTSMYEHEVRAGLRYMIDN